jgi:hypothetical protein
MEISDVQLAANRAWHIQWARCAAIGLVVVFFPFEMQRRLGDFWLFSGLASTWSVFVILTTAYMTEWTWHSWQQLRIVRRMAATPTVLEFRQLRTRERLHRSVRDFAFAAAGSGWIVFCLREAAPWFVSRQLLPLLLLTLGLAAARMGRLWREARQATV